MLNSVIASIYSVAASAATAAPNALVAKKIQLTTLDWVGAITAIVMIGTAVVFMIVMAGWMTYKAFTQHESLITSFGSPQEESFASFTETSERVHGKAWMAGLIGGEAMAFVYWQKYSDREDQPDCGVGTPCGDEGKKEARMTNIGHGVAAVSGAVFLVGVYKGFLSSGGKRTESSAVIGRQRSTRQVSVSPTLAPGGGGATVRIDF